MLSRTHFYHRITRKIVVAFGTMFNNITLKRYNKEGTAEIERVTVPLSYMSKEKFYQRFTQDPGLDRAVQISLPRMTFELDSIVYDPSRKVSAFQQYFAPRSNTSIKTTYSTPYNFNFSVNLFVRNAEDGTQIIEQILPYFNPDYTVSVNLVDINDPIDVPIILESVNYDVSGETGTSDTSMRTLNWTLTFTVKAYLFGPISNVNIIRKATANTFDSGFELDGLKIINLNTGTGDYKIGEAVFVGKTISEASASGFVNKWDNVSNVIVLTDTDGVFQVNNVIRGAVTNTSYNIASFVANTDILQNITITPNPASANVNTAFGFLETLEEFPNIT